MKETRSREAINAKNDILFRQLKNYKEDTEEYIEIRNQIVENNINLAYYIANKFEVNNSYLMDDITSHAMIGLMKAANTFDTTKGLVFATYASRCIENEILMFLRKEKKHGLEISLSATISTDKDGEEMLLEDTLSTGEDLSEECVQNFSNESILKLLPKIWVKLKPIERKVLECMYFAGEESLSAGGKKYATQREIEEMLGISQSYVCRVENVAQHKFERIFRMSEENPKLLEMDDKDRARLKGKLKDLIGTKLAYRQAQVLLGKYYSKKGVLTNAQASAALGVSIGCLSGSETLGIQNLQEYFNAQSRILHFSTDEIRGILKSGKQYQIEGLNIKQKLIENAKTAGKVIKKTDKARQNKKVAKARDTSESSAFKYDNHPKTKLTDERGLIKAEIKEIIDTKLAKFQASILKLRYFTFGGIKSCKKVSEFLDKNLKNIYSSEFYGIKRVCSIYNQNHPEEKLSSETLREILTSMASEESE